MLFSTFPPDSGLTKTVVYVVMVEVRRDGDATHVDGVTNTVTTGTVSFAGLVLAMELDCREPGETAL